MQALLLMGRRWSGGFWNQGVQRAYTLEGKTNSFRGVVHAIKKIKRVVRSLGVALIFIKASGLSGEVTFGSQRGKIWRKSIPGGGNSKSKGLKV